MGKWRFVEFFKTAGTLGGGSVTLAILSFGISAIEHARDHNVAASIFALLTIIFFCFGAYLAWDEQRKQRLAIEGERDRVQEQLANRSPHVALQVMPLAGNDWLAYANHPSPLVFYLAHYGGDGARDVRVGPIVAPNGKALLLFDPVNLVNGPVRHFIPFWVGTRERDLRETRFSDGQTIDRLLHFFFKVNPEDLPCIKYEVPIEFRWDGKIIRETCELHYATGRRQLNVHQLTSATSSSTFHT